MTLDQWLSLFGHFLLLSLLGVGGAITTAPDMHRFVVDRQGWLSDTQFNASIAIAQAAPGPNMLFIPLIGWQTGLALGGSYSAAVQGLLATFIGIMLPSSILTFAATRWLQKNSEHVIANWVLISQALMLPALAAVAVWLSRMDRAGRFA